MLNTFFVQQTRIKSAICDIKPSLDEAAVSAPRDLQDLEDLINMDIVSLTVNAPSAPAYVAANAQSAPVDDLNLPANVQGSALDNLIAPEDVQNSTTENIQSVTSTQVTFQSAAEPAQGQREPPFQSYGSLL